MCEALRKAGADSTACSGDHSHLAGYVVGVVHHAWILPAARALSQGGSGAVAGRLSAVAGGLGVVAERHARGRALREAGSNRTGDPDVRE